MSTKTKELTFELFQQLWTDDITKSEWNRIVRLARERACAVWVKLLALQNRKWIWYDFDNEGGEEAPGTFDPKLYQNEVRMIGEYYGSYDGPFEEGFPTRFLWEPEWEEEVKQATKEHRQAKEEKKAKAKLKREKTKKKKAEMRKQIEAKLTKEELKYIKFK